MKRARCATVGSGMSETLVGNSRVDHPNGESAPESALTMPALTGLRRPSPFPPIASYAFLSDCEVNALVAPSGNVEWLCLPRPAHSSVFGAILDRSAGGFRIGPADSMVRPSRRYLPGTLVLETVWRTRRGWIVVEDALLIGPWHAGDRRLENYRRAPTDTQAEHVLLRTVRCVNGTVEVSLDCEPAFNYGSSRARWAYAGPGYGVAEASCSDSDIRLRLTTDLRLGIEGHRASARTRLAAGQSAFAALCWADVNPPQEVAEAN